jgi:hypothetical protein
MIAKILDTVLVLIGAVVLTLILMVWFTDPSKNYRYTIDVEGRSHYYTNYYTYNGSCIKFKDGEGDTITICGNYSLRSNR